MTTFMQPPNGNGIRRSWRGRIMLLLLLASVVGPPAAAAQEQLTLRETIDAAIAANLDLKAAREGTAAARSIQAAERTRFFPSLSASYQYRRNDEATRTEGVGITAPEDEYSFVGTVSQPLFTGFSNLNRYRIAQLGLDAARIETQIARREVILDAKTVFFTILKAKKLKAVAEQAVRQLTAHRDVARHFHEAGMTPLNEVLKAEVELANARQELVSADNDLEIARSRLNLLLRRPLDTTFTLDETIQIVSFDRSLDFCIRTAEENRLELKIARLDVEIAEKEIRLGKTDYFPSVDLEGNYYQRGDDWDLDGGPGISNPHRWDVTAVASWTFWEWGRTGHTVREKRSRMAQARYNQEEISDQVQLEVKSAYLRTKESEKNIITAKQAVAQARESFRISTERYKEQVATSTDVLDAQTLLTRTMSSYYRALYDFMISKASLFRAMGLEIIG